MAIRIKIVTMLINFLLLFLTMKIVNLGKSIGVIIPKKLALTFDFIPGTEVDMDINKDDITLHKAWIPDSKYLY